MKTSNLSTGSFITESSVVMKSLSCGNSISVLNIDTRNIYTDLTVSSVINSTELSTHNLYSEISKLGLLSVSNATIKNTFCSILSCSAFTCDDIISPRANFDILSVNSIVGFTITQLSVQSLFLSLNESLNETFDEKLNNLINGSLNQLVNEAVNQSIVDLGLELSINDMNLNSLSCSSGNINDLTSNVIFVDALSASEIAVSSLSVASLHGIVLTQELSVTGLANHISSSFITTSDLSCGTLFINNIVRQVPHISDTTNPAILTTSTLGDFALFSDETKHSGDMIIEGSLYVTDTIFMGTQPSLNIENVQNITASNISVGELAVGMLTGIGGGTLGGSISDVVTNLLSVSPHDTVHEGNMQIEGNLIVSGVVLTGAHNKLMHNHGYFNMDGTLSLSGDIISNGINIIETLLSLHNKLESIV
jgi:hypothetical protein